MLSLVNESAARTRVETLSPNPPLQPTGFAGGWAAGRWALLESV
jgi:hypothetical protein